mgnify:CR=1 FL=1
MVGNVELGGMDKWARFYAEVMGFANLITFDDKDISTKYTALMSKVMTNGNGRIKFPINEPAMGLKKSQIEEYLDFYKGPGCQHIAVATDNIIFTISEMRKRGVEFLHVCVVVRGHNHAAAAVANLEQQVQYLTGGLRVEVAGGFVGED